jgi:hypothetical protein
MRRSSSPPEAMSEANAEWCADINKENRELRATIVRLNLKSADDDAVKARSSNSTAAPEEMIALPVALGLCPAKHDWAVKQIKLGKVKGEQRGGRWWVMLSSLQKRTKTVFGWWANSV